MLPTSWKESPKGSPASRTRAKAASNSSGERANAR